MSPRVDRAKTAGEVAMFFLVAGVSPPVGTTITDFVIDHHLTRSLKDAVSIFDSIPKPVFCEGHLLGHSLHIATVRITNEDALRARHEFLRLTAGGAFDSASRAPSTDVLLKSRDAALLASADLLRQFYREYDVPYSSSHDKNDVGAGGIPLVRIGPPGSAEIEIFSSEQANQPDPE
jgi:hypothetical protein